MTGSGFGADIVRGHAKCRLEPKLMNRCGPEKNQQAWGTVEKHIKFAKEVSDTKARGWNVQGGKRRAQRKNVRG